MARTIHPELPIGPHRPQAECFMLCDFARFENGKLYIVGGGWTEIVPQQLPLEYQAYLAIKAALPWKSLVDGATIRVELMDVNGRVLGDPILEFEMAVDADRPIDLDEDGAEQPPLFAEVHLAPPVQMALNTPGRFILHFRVNEETISATSFVVTPPSADIDPGREQLPAVVNDLS